MEQIHVKVSKPYDVLIGRNLIDEIADIINPIVSGNQIAIITDDVVANLYLKKIEQQLNGAGYRVCSFSFPHGEKSKNIQTLSDILEFLAENGIRRNDMLIALGGGVVGDITGLAASLFMRGVSVIQIPTTLLSAVDSSVGGKTAIDLLHGKNLAGAFWQPSMVVCDVKIIESLPDDIFCEGMAEVIKCNVIKKLPILEWIEKRELKQHLERVIYECIALKRDIVEQDEFDDQGIRNILNVGHTFAHAIEKLSGYQISHGQAVGTGLVTEAVIAHRLGMCDENTVCEIQKAVDQYHLMVDVPWKAEEVVEAMKSDKKNRDAKIVFELPYALGQCVEKKIDKFEVCEIQKLLSKTW